MKYMNVCLVLGGIKQGFIQVNLCLEWWLAYRSDYAYASLETRLKGGKQ